MKQLRSANNKLAYAKSQRAEAQGRAEVARCMMRYAPGSKSALYKLRRANSAIAQLDKRIEGLNAMIAVLRQLEDVNP